MGTPSKATSSALITARSLARGAPSALPCPRMTPKPPPPATKEDIQMLMEQIGRLYDANEHWKDEVIEETKRHFDLTVETIRHDLLGVGKDRIENHEGR